jgi:hypothetical protein
MAFHANTALFHRGFYICQLFLTWATSSNHAYSRALRAPFHHFEQRSDCVETSNGGFNCVCRKGFEGTSCYRVPVE